MKYQHFLNKVQDLGIVDSEERADAATKAVLGILANEMQEDDARKLTESLPDPLTYDRLRGHQMSPTGIRADQYVDEIAEQFNIDEYDAERLVKTVLDTAKDAVGENAFERFGEHLPPDWQSMLRSV